MLIKTRQKPPKDGWYKVEYSPEAPVYFQENCRAFYEGRWRRGKYPTFLEETSIFSRYEDDKYDLASYKPFLEQ